jgi:predicted negative regulator of RcsB-dependent stress response
MEDINIGQQSDQEQVELLKKWWHTSGRYILTGICFGLAFLGAWRGYQNYLDQQSEEASALYQMGLVDVKAGRGKEAMEKGKALLTDHANSAYALYSSLSMARLAVSQKDYAGARKFLDFVIERSKDAELRRLARARVAEIQLAEGKADQALATLDAMEPAASTDPYVELRGDCLLALGKRDEAIATYRKVIANAKTSHQDATSAHLKLEDLGADEESLAEAP